MSENAVARYEALILAVPEITTDEASTLESQIHSLISQLKGEILSFERWGKYKLAYKVRKNDYGVYFLVRFDLPENGQTGSVMEEVRRLFAIKYRDIVMRFIFSSLDPNAPLTYKRPESLEEMPRRDAEGPRYTAEPAAMHEEHSFQPESHEESLEEPKDEE
ncbi:MAG: 30S ribosomal protein S6 [Candidatus Dependentiae bacterium]|nr:30S ribosomal protein S6 [Candidatus Dependentiae bacterium]